MSEYEDYNQGEEIEEEEFFEDDSAEEGEEFEDSAENEEEPFFEEEPSESQDDEDDDEISDEELDHVADTAIEILRDILSYFGEEEVGIDEYEGDEGEIVLDTVGENHAILIGRHGRTLESIQSLLSSILYKRLGFRYPVVIDVGGYKYRRKQKIEGDAKRAAHKATTKNSSIRMRPMTPYERRIVHMVLREDPSVTTSSEGSDPNRYVVVRPV